MDIKEMTEEFLACPKCLGNLLYKEIEGKKILVCKNCRVYYTVEDEIPILLIEDAKSIDELYIGADENIF
jgi:uncharacterized protein YbaR (Trm112 family)